VRRVLKGERPWVSGCRCDIVIMGMVCDYGGDCDVGGILDA
jgi:hypothetical protein